MRPFRPWRHIGPFAPGETLTVTHYLGSWDWDDGLERVVCHAFARPSGIACFSLAEQEP